MSRHLHIVCLDAPCPAHCGGSIDMMNRIRAFAKKGILIHLHYFKHKDQCEMKELKRLCVSVQAYERKEASECLSLSAPYFVTSRCNTNLVEEINKDAHPVLLEGLHTTGILNDIMIHDRRICIRMHNEESVYYRELARCTSNPAKKTYYLAESILAKKYTGKLPKDCMYACISEQDQSLLEDSGFTNVVHIPAFPSWQRVESHTGVGHLCLFHGNLSVTANEKAASWLLNNVFNKVRIPFIIAGKNPSKSLEKSAGLCQNTCLVSNPCENEMNDLVEKAHINILPNFNKHTTGIRLKLLHSLYKGRHCVTTPAMVEGSGLETACHIGANANAIASIISQLYYQPFEEDEIELRKYLLYDTYDNDKNVEKFINYLW